MRMQTARTLYFGTIFTSLAVVGTVAWQTAPTDPRPLTPPHVAVCHSATGKGESPCWHYDEQASSWILNLDNGRTFYVIDTQDVITR